jgi:glycine cleavage system H protein
MLVGDVVTIGISQTAADELTDITFVALPKSGDKVSVNARWGEIESVKATADLYSGVSGTIIEVNGELNANPSLVNTDPFNAGWMIKVKVDDPQQTEKLLTAEDYLKKTGH